MDHPKFIEFYEKYGEAADNLIQIICEVDWSNSNRHESIKALSVHRHDAINVTLSGNVEHDGKLYGFVIENGNNNGTVIREWGNSEEVKDYVPEEPTRYVLIIDPKHDDLKRLQPTKYALHEARTTDAESQELLRAYHYDKYFQPGCVIEDYYREKAAKRGMIIVSEEYAKNRKN